MSSNSEGIQPLDSTCHTLSPPLTLPTHPHSQCTLQHTVHGTHATCTPSVHTTHNTHYTISQCMHTQPQYTAHVKLSLTHNIHCTIPQCTSCTHCCTCLTHPHIKHTLHIQQALYLLQTHIYVYHWHNTHPICCTNTHTEHHSASTLHKPQTLTLYLTTYHMEMHYGI